MVYWILFIAIIFPWIEIGAKFELVKKIFIFFENIMQSPERYVKKISKGGLFPHNFLTISKVFPKKLDLNKIYIFNWQY